jgi:uncharacterized protein (TIGR02246 family)
VIKPSTVICLVAALALSAGCGSTPRPAPGAATSATIPAATAPRPDAAALWVELGAQIDKNMAAMQNKDVRALVAAFTPDATWVLPDSSAAHGAKDIEVVAMVFMSLYESARIEATTLDKLVVISATEALTFATARYSMTLNGKSPETRQTTFADYWTLGADGAWRVAYEVNSDGVVPPPTLRRN